MIRKEAKKNRGIGTVKLEGMETSYPLSLFQHSAVKTLKREGQIRSLIFLLSVFSSVKTHFGSLYFV